MKAAIVTGAGTGIGRETALLLAEAGWALSLVGRRKDKIESTAAAAGGRARALAVAGDLAEAGTVDRVVEATLREWGRADLLVNNAAAIALAPIAETTPELLEEIFAVNAFAPALLVARLWPVFVRQGGGCVVNVSSMSSVDPFAGLSVYGTAKSALESLTRSIVNEGRAHGIRAFSVVPGCVETPMLRSLWSEDEIPGSQAIPPRRVAQVVVDCALGRRDRDIGRAITP